MIERIKAWIRHKLGWKTPTEVIDDMDLGKVMREAFDAVECLGEMSEEDFECEMCHEVFPTEWTEEEANAEALKQFGIEDASKKEDMARVCDSCYAELAEHYGWELEHDRH